MLLFLACAKYANLPADTGWTVSSCSNEDTSLSIAVVGDIVSPALSNLYFAGEVLNIDGVTGGFNFQAAWTTGYIAGQLKY